MRPSFHPRLINGPFNDPGLFIPFLFQKRAFVFDIGEIGLPAKDMLKISHVFVTHTHMDHFIGFDHLLRTMLGREKILSLFGPRDFIKNVEGKLSAYTWNLADNYGYPLCLQITEVHPDITLYRKYRCRERFEPSQDAVKQPFDGVLYEEPAFRVSAVILDHKIPCLGLSIKERFHVNIVKEGLKRLGLEPGPWLSDFKQALYSQTDPAAKFELDRPGQPDKKQFALENLARQIAQITPGQKITYITDVVYSDFNRDKIVEFARDSDHLFIEAAFMEKDRRIAAEKYHLTARQAGELAARAGARQFNVFHFSPRYTNQECLLYQEAFDAYNKFIC
ncbi:Metal-dependent hydrolases of the beta-lactamase superfamily III [Olavius sp. associated proteobacterium Delta 1]|nr:Metal-dependent hydrolases of the beta-lactamase superfamily III [Olavius sp. associated proteobacterium Delta 1]